MWWRRWCAGLVAAAAVLLPGTPAAAVDELSRLQAFLVERMRTNGAPGLSYALVRGDEVVASGGWGTDGFGRPMTARTPVGFGSVSKPVTATAVLRLVDAGAVGLDDPVVDHLPWFQLADQRSAARITVRHLLEQTSGISPADGYARSDLDDNAPGAIRRWVADLAGVTPTAAPGERHQYSPANATILAAMTEEVTELSFADVVRREVFTPLDMADGVAAARDAERLPPGHEYYFGTVRPAERTFDTSGLAYGYLAGSATDLAHLALPLVDDGRFGGARFLAEDTVTDLRRGGPAAAGGRYSLGWRTGTLSTVDTPIVWHAGAVTGYHSIVITAPEAGWAIAVQQNIWSPLHDEELNAAAFGALTVALGGDPDAPPGSSTETVALAGLGALVLALAGALAWTVRRLFRRSSGRRFDRRTVLAAAGGIGLGTLAAVAGWWLPSVFDLQLRHVVRFMPDIGQLTLAVLVLGPALAVTRFATLIIEARRR